MHFRNITAALGASLLLAMATPAATAEALAFVNIAGMAPSAPAPSSGSNADVEKVLTRPADLWERIRNGFGIPALDHPLVREHERWFVERPDQLRAILARGRLYLHFIVEATEQRDLPLELVLVPIIESGFNPMALSPAQAAGLWQFIPGTGTRFGLEQSHDLDERRDVMASTAAALQYLGKLYAQFGDWHLALASYNWGENAVARAAERVRAAGKPVTFGTLSLPEETRNYVPRILALSNIIANPAAFGIALEEIPNKPYFARIALRTEVDFPTAAKLSDMTQEELRALNPGLHRSSIERGTRSSVLVLPVEKVDDFRTNLESYEAALNASRESPRRPARKPRP